MDFTFHELQNLDQSTKECYMHRILNQDAQISCYIKKVCDIVEHTEDQLVDIQYEIDNTKEDWNREMTEINQKIYNGAVQNGITGKDFEFMTQNLTCLDKDYQKNKEKRFTELKKRLTKEELSKVDVDKEGNILQIKDRVSRLPNIKGLKKDYDYEESEESN